VASVPQPISQFERLLSTTASGCSLEGSGRKDEPLRQSIFGLLAFQKGLRNILAQVKASLQRNVTVFIAGETGTGKELIAQAIHEMSSRSGHRPRGAAARLGLKRTTLHYKMKRFGITLPSNLP
jgi:transcriptional regulator with GAF, ATPase, and Fis domain